VGQVIIGMDLHKRSATIEIITDREKILAQGRFGTDRASYRTMLQLGRQGPCANVAAPDRPCRPDGGRPALPPARYAARECAAGEPPLKIPVALSSAR